MMMSETAFPMTSFLRWPKVFSAAGLKSTIRPCWSIVMMGFQSILMGLVAETQVRTYYESQGKPTYTVRRRLG